MATFRYSARDASGAAKKGTLEAGSRREAIAQLNLRKLVPVKVEEGMAGPVKTKNRSKPLKSAKETSSLVEDAPRGKGLSAKRDGSFKAVHRLPFLRALADLISSGMPVGDAVRLLGSRFRDPILKAIAQRLWEGVSSGMSVSEAMGQLPRVFDASTVYLIQAGEATGSLKEILRRLVAYLEERQALFEKVRLALAYPAFIFALATGVLLFCIYFLFPRMESLLLSLGGDLPPLTRYLMDGSAFMVDYGLFMLIGLVLILLILWRWMKTSSGQLMMDKFFLRLPLLGRFFLYRDVLSVTQTFSALLENGITTIDAIKMTENVVANRALRERFIEVRPLVADGASISAAFEHTGCFPDLVLDMIGVGENTGNIVPSLKEVSRQMDKKLSDQLRRFTTAITSCVLLMAVSFVGIVAIAIFSAVFSLSAQFT